MNFGGHLITGWLLGNAGGRTLAERRFITVMAIAPDIDGTLVFIPGFMEQWHRTFSHNVFFFALAPLTTFLFFKRRRLSILLYAYLAIVSHLLLDLVATGWWGLRPFWPLSNYEILMSRYIPENVMKYYVQISLLVLLIGAVVILYRQLRRTPLEVISPALDKLVTTFLIIPFKHHCCYCRNRAFYQDADDGSPLCGRHIRFEKWFVTRKK